MAVREALVQAEQQAPKAPAPKKISEAAAAFLRHCEQDLGKDTVRKLRYTLRDLGEFCHRRGVESVPEVTTDLLEAYLAQRHAEAMSKTLELQRLRKFFLHCVNRKWLAENPAKRIKPFKGKKAASVSQTATGVPEGDGGTIRLGQFFDLFEQRHLSEIGIAVQQKYTRYWRKYIEPEFAGFRLCDIDPGRVDEWLKRSNFRPWVKDALWNAMRSIFSKACKWRYLRGPNPFKQPVGKPKAKKAGREGRATKEITFDELTKRYFIPNVMRASTMKETSQRTQISQLKKHILPVWGSRLLSEASLAAIQQFLKDKREGRLGRPCSPAFVADLLAMMGRLYKHALRLGFWEGSLPTEFVPPPEMRQHQRPELSAEQLRRYVAEVPRPFNAWLSLVSVLGLAQREASAPRWKYVNYTDKLARVGGEVLAPHTIGLREKYIEGEVSPLSPYRRCATFPCLYTWPESSKSGE